MRLRLPLPLPLLLLLLELPAAAAAVGRDLYTLYLCLWTLGTTITAPTPAVPSRSRPLRQVATGARIVDRVAPGTRRTS